MNTSLAVVFASFNGGATLPRMLARLAELDTTGLDVEIVAVDNGSTDETPRLLAHAAASARQMRVLLHRPRGKNRCLNAALSTIQSDLIVLTDDDVLPAVDWLQRFEQAARRCPEYSIFGGSIYPVWPHDPPAWVLNSVPMGSVFGVHGAKLVEGPASPDLIWGGNMMIRRTVLAAGLRFNEDIGPSSGQYTMGGETEFNARAAKAGYGFLAVPQATVGHLIEPAQLEYDWIVGRGYRSGRGAYFRRHQVDGKAPPRLLMPAVQWRWFARQYAQRWLLRRSADLAKRFRADWDVNFTLGWLSAAMEGRRTHGST